MTGHAHEAEHTVLGGILAGTDGIELALAEGLRADDFESERNRTIYRAALRVHERGDNTDPGAVKDELTRTGDADAAGGMPYLAELLDACWDTATVSPKAKAVRKAAQRRHLSLVLHTAATEAATAEDPATVAGQLQAQLRDTLTVMDGGKPSATPLSDLPPDEPIEWFMRGGIPAGEPVLVVADGGVGKTSVLLALGGSAANGSPAFGHRDFRMKAGPVLFISEEDPGNVIRNRLEALGAGMGWDMERVRSRFHLLALTGVQLDQPEWREHILSEVERIRPVAVVLDPYSDVTAAKENDNDETKPFKRFLRDIGLRGATPITAHHLGKAIEGKRKQDRIRGASALDQASRCTLYLSHDDAGIRVEWLKLSRAEKPRAFVLKREIEVEAHNVGSWTRARLVYMTQAAAEDDVAEDFIRDQLTREPHMNSTALRDAAKGTGVNAAALAAAQNRMEARGEIAYEPAKHGAKNWYLTTLPDESRQPRQPTLSTLPDVARQPGEVPEEVAYPIEGATPARVPDPAGNHGCINPDCSQDVGRDGVPCSDCYANGWREGEAA